MMRQIGKQFLTLAGLRTFFLGLVFVLGSGTSGIGAASRVVPGMVVDPLSGVALNGYDAVTYFTEAEPVPGRPEFEFYWKGVPWFFSSAANLEIFAKAPEIYAPQFGGHGTMSLARGFFSDGNPLIYRVLDNRLYLFYSFGNREAFSLVDKTARVKAMDTWQKSGFAEAQNRG
ncbi:MAG TPA: hypothetical protein ENJ90_10235 [Devosia sp.]|nr:hypothetical protein [Devosia sp.]